MRKQYKKLIASLLSTMMIVQAFLPATVFAVTSTIQEYDENGNLTKDYNDKCYEYNEANQLKKIYDCISTLSVISEYWYGPDGQRIKEINYDVSGYYDGTTYFPGNGFEHYRLGNGGFTWTYDTSFYSANGETLARKNDDGTYIYYHNDHLGSPNLQTDQDATTSARAEFSAFGRSEPTRSSSSLAYNNRVQFTGQREDHSGLNYYGARYYSSSLRHFTQPDPMLPNVYDPQQLNRYAYVRNNPMKYTDHSGNNALIIKALATAWAIFEGIGDLIDTSDTVRDIANEGLTDENTARLATDLGSLADPTGVLELAGEGYLQSGALASNLEADNYRGAALNVGAVGLSVVGNRRLAKVDGFKFGSQKLQDIHVNKHLDEFHDLGVKNANDYLNRAGKLYNRADSKGVQRYTRSNGQNVIFDSQTNEFGVFSSDGTVETLFRLKDGASYYLDDLKNHIK